MVLWWWWRWLIDGGVVFCYGCVGGVCVVVTSSTNISRHLCAGHSCRLLSKARLGAPLGGKHGQQGGRLRVAAVRQAAGEVESRGGQQGGRQRAAVGANFCLMQQCQGG